MVSHEFDHGSIGTLENSISNLSLSSSDTHLSELAQDVITSPEVYDRILDNCSPAGLVRFSRICKDAYESLQSYYHRGFNINRHLSRYFDDPLAFRSLQARTGTLISGSDALQFLDRSFYSDSDLDLYADTAGTLAVGLWLIEAGYSYQPRPGQIATFDLAHSCLVKNYDEYFQVRPSTVSQGYFVDMRSVAEVFNFIKIAEPGQPPLQVQIVSAMISPLACILSFHSTCVMNFITHDKAYSLYPRATFEDRRTISCSSNLLREPKSLTYHSLQKYQGRGWEVLDRLPGADAIHGRDRALQVGFRWADDGHTWIVPLSTHGVEVPPASVLMQYPYSSANIIRAANWAMRKVVLEKETAVLSLGQIRSQLLLSTYVITDESLYDLLNCVFKDLRRRTASGGQPSGLYFDDVFLAICKEYRSNFSMKGVFLLRFFDDVARVI